MLNVELETSNAPSFFVNNQKVEEGEKKRRLKLGESSSHYAAVKLDSELSFWGRIFIPLTHTRFTRLNDSNTEVFWVNDRSIKKRWNVDRACLQDAKKKNDLTSLWKGASSCLEYFKKKMEPLENATISGETQKRLILGEKKYHIAVKEDNEVSFWDRHFTHVPFQVKSDAGNKIIWVTKRSMKKRWNLDNELLKIAQKSHDLIKFWKKSVLPVLNGTYK